MPASSPNAGSPAIRRRQAGARHLPQPAQNLLQARHFVLGLPRGPAEDPGRRHRALAPRSHPAERLRVAQLRSSSPLSAGETDQVPVRPPIGGTPPPGPVLSGSPSIPPA